MNPADLILGLLLTLGSAAYLAHGWRRQPHDPAAEQASRQRHPSGRAA